MSTITVTVKNGREKQRKDYEALKREREKANFTFWRKRNILGDLVYRRQSLPVNNSGENINENRLTNSNEITSDIQC